MNQCLRFPFPSSHIIPLSFSLKAPSTMEPSAPTITQSPSTEKPVAASTEVSYQFSCCNSTIQRSMSFIYYCHFNRLLPPQSHLILVSHSFRLITQHTHLQLGTQVNQLPKNPPTRTAMPKRLNVVLISHGKL